MAKRKLSESQRASIRNEIKKRRSAGVQQSEILDSISKKYSISPESVRWYLKDPKKRNPPESRKEKSPKNGQPAHARIRTQRRKKKIVSPSKPAANAHGISLLEIAKNVSAAGLRRVLEAKKHLPRLEALLKKHADLEEVERTVKSSIAAVRGKLGKLKRKIGRLTTR